MPSKSSITTRGGDQGKTSTLGGERVLKNDPRVVLPGFVDEVITHVGWIKLILSPTDNRLELLTWIQTCLFVVASRLSDPEVLSPFVRQIEVKEVDFITRITSEAEQKTAMPQGFILPSSTESAYRFDLVRIKTRELERKVVEFTSQCVHHKISSATFAFLNRLSDLFYIWARAEEQGKFIPVDYNFIEDLPRKRGGKQ